MNNAVSDAEILREFGVLFAKNSHKVSQVGGFEPLLAMFRKGKFFERLSSMYGVFRARSLMQFIIGVISGARSMHDVARIGLDPVVKRYLRNCSVGEAQLGRDFRSFTKQEIEDLHDFNISLAIYDLLDSLKKSEDAHKEPLIFDVDSTAVEKYGTQEGVEPGYVAKDQILACYQYLFFRLANRNTFLYGSLRSGSSHSQNGFCDYLNRFLPMLKTRWQSKWRMDSGYFNESAFDIFSENDGEFFVKAPMSETRLLMAQTSEDLVWQEVEHGVFYASRVTCTFKGTKWREVFKKTLKVSSQLSLLTEYRYQCVGTNNLTMTELEIFKFYNARANIENNIKELKEDYQLGKIVTDSFDANDMITQATLLGYLLMSHFKAIALPPKYQRHRLCTLRWQVFNIPGYMLSFARRSVVKLHNLFNDENFYAQIFKSIKDSMSWVLKPPKLYLAI